MDIGIVGLGVMGKNLVKNFLDSNFSCGIFNRTFSKAQEFENEINNETKLKSFPKIQDLIANLKTPRKIILLIPSGTLVDEYIEIFTNYLEKDDIVLDFGNSFYKDTIRRSKIDKFHFMGVGISGGEEGARHGASLMIGGDSEAFQKVGRMLDSVAAKFDGCSCSAYIGPNGAGHYVKMVHNGIEYADMALLAESHGLFNHIFDLNSKNPKLQRKNDSRDLYVIDCFTYLQKNEFLNGYLLDIMIKILMSKLNGEYAIHLIDDRAQNKGTGSWSVISSFEEGCPTTLTASAVNSRCISEQQKKRNEFGSRILERLHPSRNARTVEVSTPNIYPEIQIQEVEKAMVLSKAINYCQNLQLISQKSEKEGWNIDLQNLCSIWRSGCIIKGSFLKTASEMCRNQEFESSNVFLEIYIQCISSLRRVVMYCLEYSLQCECFNSALLYIENLGKLNTNGNVIQALRDYFGSHKVLLKGNISYSHLDWERLNK